MSGSTLTSGPIGWYGKLPAVGDFVQRHLPDDFVTTWDAWLRAGMDAAAKQSADTWRERFPQSPAWYFLRDARAAGDTGDTGNTASLWAGMLVPSADRVGRLFPMTVAFSLPPELFMQTGFPPIEARLEAIETHVLDALGGSDLPDFERKLAMLTPLTAPCTARPAHTIAPGALLQRLGAQALLLRLRENTLFWAPDAGPPETLILAPEPLQAETFCKLVQPSTAILLAD